MAHPMLQGAQATSTRSDAKAASSSPITGIPTASARSPGRTCNVGVNVQVGDRWLGKIHLPTGAVGLAQVVALAIVELGVEPLRGDWERLIEEAADR